MAKKPARRHTPSAIPTPFDEARDELFQHIMQCGVIGSEPDHQGEWFEETMKYLAERYHELSPEQLKQNLAAVNVKLSAEEMAALDKASELPREYPGWMLERQGGERTTNLS